MQAQTFRLLHAFKGPDGSFSNVSLIRDSAGNLYGTTDIGGTSNLGTVFKLDKTHKLTTLHNFTGGADGGNPVAALIRDAVGNLYGTAATGGTAGHGIVYKIDPSGTETVLYDFTGGADGAQPEGRLVRDKAGNLYGTASAGGVAGCGNNFDGCGTAFKLDTTGKLTALYAFTGGADGDLPTGSLVRDAAGNLYGTCLSGAVFFDGTVYKLDTTGTLTVLHSFDGTDGANPWGGLIADAAGNLYGTTVQGGSRTFGTVFQVLGTSSFTVLHSFDGTEGSAPYATLVRDLVGNLYGANAQGGCRRSCGTIWKLDTNNRVTVLTNFGKGNQGRSPVGGMVLDRVGNLYGTTSQGANCYYCGTVFKITP